MNKLVRRVLLAINEIKLAKGYSFIDMEIINELLNLGHNPLDIENKINKLLIDMVNNEYENEEDNNDTAEDTELISKFLYLDKIFYSSLNESIDIGINESMVGNEYSYVMKDYRIDTINNNISMILKRNGDEYKLFLSEIISIDWNSNKVWIYMKDKTWRFYHHIDDIVINSLPSNFRSKNIEFKQDLDIYKKYENTNEVLYHVEKYKYKLRNSGVKFYNYEAKDKDGNQLIYVTGFYEDEGFKPTGDIYAFSKRGKEGQFFYKFNQDSVYIVDIQPNSHSKGVGSGALKFIEEIAIKFNKSKITGTLSAIDFDHKQRLFHFYKKNGYTINSNESSIVKILNSSNTNNP